MHKLSILVGLTGSEQSKLATELAWSIAKRIKGKVTVSHVVDTRMIWELLRNDRPGFIGSGVYIEAFESFSDSLNTIGEALLKKFQTVAEGQSIPTESLLERGSPVRRLSERAKDHDLLVVGHQPRDHRGEEQEHCNFIRYAVAEGLSQECPKPLLIVQGSPHWTSMSILASVDHLNFSYINACIKMAALLGLEPKVVALASGTREEPAEAILKDLRRAHPELADVDVTIETMRGIAIEKDASPWHTSEIELDWRPDPDTLLVIPTRRTGGHRLTIFDTSADAFVRCLALPTIMMWPEEHTDLDVKVPLKEKSASAR